MIALKRVERRAKRMVKTEAECCERFGFCERVEVSFSPKEVSSGSAEERRVVSSKTVKLPVPRAFRIPSTAGKVVREFVEEAVEDSSDRSDMSVSLPRLTLPSIVDT